jgi:hypothetical protein
MKVNIVPKRSSGGLPFSATHFQQGGPFASGASNDGEPLIISKRIQQAGSQRAYIETNEPEMPAMLPSGLPKELAEFEHLLARETQLLDQLKLQFKTGHHPATLSPQLSANPHNQDLINELPLLTSEQQSKRVAQELRTILESKKIVLSALMPSLVDNAELAMKEQAPKPMVALPPPLPPTERLMSITSQPAEIAVANRYLMPGPVVTVALNQLPKSETGTLIVSVKLFYHASGKEVTTTIHGKQEILQGIRQVTVDKLGRAIFNKLKIMEVSSKHRHQSFCLEFALEEYSAQGLKRTITNAKSTPFHVQSRPAKRKREPGEEEGAFNGREGEAGSDMGSPNGASAGGCGQKKNPNGKDKKLKRSNDGGAGSAADGSGADDTSGKDSSSAASAEGNYIDITDLLTLPQKEAAKKLGISESMLCKRFKECTRRKWPYRYLRKIDKIINMLNLHKADGDGMSEEDRDKLTRLHKEREECLRPVKIRITSYDRLSPVMRNRKTSDCDEEDIPIDALQTLEMLRIFKPQGDGELSECGSAERDGNSSSEDDDDELEDDLLDVDGLKRRKATGTGKLGDEGEEQEDQLDELQVDADGDEDESECSMHLANDDQPNPLASPQEQQLQLLQQQHQQHHEPVVQEAATLKDNEGEYEMETMASGRLPR